ncbi:MAG: T9SS type A sorting domain-containing protein [Draconibacterium sp.]
MITKTLFASLLLCIQTTSFGQTQFWSDTFEDTGAPSSGSRTPSTSFSCGSPATAYFMRTDNTGINLQNGTYSNYEGSKFWAGEDIDKGPTCTNGSLTDAQQVTWSGINITGKTGLSVKGLFAADPIGSFQGSDWGAAQDKMEVEYRIDGGTWIKIIAFYAIAANSSSGSTGGLYLETTGDLLGDGPGLTYSFAEFSALITGTGSTLDLRVNCFANATAVQEIAFDNIRLYESPAASAPSVTTSSISVFTSSSATMGGNITATGGANITERGIYWSLINGFANGAGTKVSTMGDWSSTGAFSQSVTDLSPNTTYYVKAFATNSAGTSYGDQVSFTTNIGELTWDGSENTNWHTADNWDGGLVPDGNYNVTIPAGLTNYPALYMAGECNNLTIESSETSSSSLKGQFNLTVNGTTTIERYLTGDAWHIVSSPAPGQTISSFLSANSNVPSQNVSETIYRGMMDYNEPNNDWNTFFLNTDQTGDLTAGKGFSLRTDANGVVAFTGTLATGTVNTMVARTENYGWNCVGNPYPSAIFINQDADFEVNFIDINANNLDDSYGAIYLWEETNNAYTIIDQSETAFYAQPGQGFFVKVKTDATQVQFITDMQTALHPDAAFKSGITELPEVKLTATMGEKNSTTRIKFNDKTTVGLDFGYDAGIFKTGFDVYTKLVEDNGVDFSLQSLPLTDIRSFEIPVGVDIKSGGEISFSLEKNDFPTDMIPVLNDKLTGTHFVFNSEEDIYITTITEDTKGYGRFTLTFSSTTAINLLNNGSHFRAWYNNGYVSIAGEIKGKSEVSVYDVRGKKIATGKPGYSNQNRIKVPQSADGIYLVRIKDATRSEILKVVITEN